MNSPDSTPAVSPELAQRFSIEAELLSTLSTQGYAALDRTRGGPVLLVILRATLAPGSEAAQSFMNRLQALSERGAANILDGGVDSSGVAFAVLPQPDGASSGTQRIEAAEAERRFIAMARIVERIHATGEFCGDLSPFSFWISRSGDVILNGCLGVTAEMSLPSADDQRRLLPYCAPEVVNGVGGRAASDVYSLGMIGCFLLTGNLPDSQGNLPGPMPQWANDLFSTCCDLEHERRPQNASEMLKMLADIRIQLTQQNHALVVKKGVAQRNPDTSLKQPENAVALHPTKPAVSPDPAAADAPKVSRSVITQRTIMLAAVLLIAIVSIIGGAQIVQQRRISHRIRELKHAQLGAVAGNPQLERAVEVLANPDSSVEDKKRQFENLANLDDPLAHGMLVQTAHEASIEEDRLLAERALVERARRLGLVRAAEQVRQWLRALTGDELPPVYDSALRALDVSLPPDARKTVLTQIFARDPSFAIKLTAALALDASDPAPLQPLLAQFLLDYSRLTGASDHSLFALILADSTLAPIFGDDIIQRLEKLEEADILWLLPILANRKDAAVRPLATVALERHLTTPIRAVFLGVIRDRTDLPSDVLAALVRASAGVFSAEDVSIFGRWYDASVEKILFALCAEAPEENIRLEALDTLASRTLTMEPGASLVGWLRDHRWENRAQYAQSIGILTHADKLTPEELSAKYASFGVLVKETDALEILVQSVNPAVSKIIVEKNADQLGLGGLVNLLRHSDAELRISAIKALKDVNDLALLKMIKDRYAEEENEQVRQAYRDNFWVIRESSR